MYSARLVHLVMVALSISSATQAVWLNTRLIARQDLLGGLGDSTSTDPDTTTAAAAAATTTTASDPSTTSAEETTAPTSTAETTDAPTTTQDNTSPTATTTGGTTPTTTQGTTPTTGQTSPTTTNGPSSSTTSSGDSGTTGGGDGTSAASTTASASTSTRTIVYTYTGANGEESVSSTASEVVSTPTLAGSSDQNTSSGPSQTTTNTIIGVCVGVGGAIVLAVGGLLIWRLRNKRRNSEESEELVSYGNGFGGPGTAEKSEVSGPASSRSPFQSTLESYHAPTQTNAASNF